MSDTTELDARADHQVGLEELERETIVLQAALVAALGEMPAIPKARTSNYGSYAGLPEVLALARPVLAKHYLALTQRVDTNMDASSVTISTRILHVAGGWYDAGKITFPLGQNAQATGSVITYARRFAILAALGLTGTDDDDDGHAASETPPAAKSKVDDVAGALMRRMGALMDDAGVPKDRPTRRTIVASIIGRKIKSAAETTVPERERVCDQFQAIMDGRAELELVDDDTWLIHAIDPEEAT
jgi:hypothetical protein